MDAIMNAIVTANDFVNGIVWGVPLLILIFITGIYYTVRLGAFQLTHPVALFKETILKAFQKKDDSTHVPGELTL